MNPNVALQFKLNNKKFSIKINEILFRMKDTSSYYFVSHLVYNIAIKALSNFTKKVII